MGWGLVGQGRAWLEGGSGGGWGGVNGFPLYSHWRNWPGVSLNVAAVSIEMPLQTNW